MGSFTVISAPCGGDVQPLGAKRVCACVSVDAEHCPHVIQVRVLMKLFFNCFWFHVLGLK